MVPCSVSTKGVKEKAGSEKEMRARSKAVVISVRFIGPPD